MAQTKVTEDLEDRMITISLHIARGMKQLHSHEVKNRCVATVVVERKCQPIQCTYYVTVECSLLQSL